MQNIKLVTVGDRCGKTSLLITYTTNAFPQDYIPRWDNYNAHVMHNGTPYSLGLWETINQDGYERLRPLTYPQTDVFLLCYKISDPNTLERVRTTWLPEITHHCPDAPYILVGLCSDLRDDPPNGAEEVQCVTRNQGLDAAIEMGAADFFETSARLGNGVAEVFTSSIDHVINPARAKIGSHKMGNADRQCNLL